MLDPQSPTPDPQPLVLRVNGHEERVAVPTHHTLLEVLRDELKLRSVREGCGIGICGACTVLIDGKPISSCLTLAAMAEDHDVLTVEGLGGAAQTSAITPLPNPPPQGGRGQLGIALPSQGERGQFEIPLPTQAGRGQVELDPIQEAFLDRTGFQCSYCTPGILLTAKALLAEQPDASDGEIREYLAGNLCRCGSYVKILDAMHEAIARLRAG
jgi:aerobic-type carbon monoxide dehydrogenase small subunit (CoxS/CutS family)